MSPVAYVWVVPALPIAALLIIFLVTRPLDLLSRPHEHADEVATHNAAAVDATGAGAQSVSHYQGEPGYPGAPGGPVGAADIDTLSGAHGAGGALEEEPGAGHGEHGGPTPFWGQVSGIVGIVGMLGSFALSVAILFQLIGDPTLLKNGYTEHIYTWFRFGPLNYPIDFRVDSLTAIMLIVVTGVSLLVHIYSTGYMAGDVGYSRFFAYLSLFTVSMLILVLGANFLVLYIGWELVGLSSYLLIGFWYYHAPPARVDPTSDVPYPPPAQLKAFITTRLGDFGMLIGILILFTTTGTFSFTQLNTLTRGVNVTTVTIAMILIFCGAVGKSAQFPLHVWLPDAMAGPTPVSALIHAATMVAAGVYLIARLFPIYAAVAGPQALLVVGYIGGFTAIFAATIALVQNDIKGVLAYSTISQLGYMFVGLSMAETNALGINHLFTHAFFKALLFLGSGSVIHAIANQDIRKMGGLAKFMPVTALTFLIATLSISGIPPFSGFWSKDPIIGAAFERGNYIIYGMVLITAFLTAFYMFRLYLMTFGGKGARFAGFWGDEQQYRGESHAHESPWNMTFPLIVLAAVTIGIGIDGFFGYNVNFAKFLNGGVPVTYTVAPSLDQLTGIGVGLSIIGLLTAWSVYGLGIIPANVLIRNPIGAFAYRVLAHRYYIDELYGLIIKYIVLGLSNFFALFDRVVIDGFVNGLARAVRDFGDASRRSESGLVQNYGAVLFGGVLVILIVVLVASNGAVGH